jgi:hypothetical protein
VFAVGHFLALGEGEMIGALLVRVNPRVVSRAGIAGGHRLACWG